MWIVSVIGNTKNLNVIEFVKLLRSATGEGLASAKERIYGVFDGTPFDVTFVDAQTASAFADAATKLGAVVESTRPALESPE